MSIAGYRRLVVSLVGVALILLLLLWKIQWSRFHEAVEIQATWNAITGNETIRAGMQKAEPKEDAAYLEIITHASPHMRNPHLRMILERERARLIQDLIMDLHKKTGDDLGADPQVWIKKYQGTVPPTAQSATGATQPR